MSVRIYVGTSVCMCMSLKVFLRQAIVRISRYFMRMQFSYRGMVNLGWVHVFRKL